MLAIRMQRTGRKGHAMFRVVVQDSHRHPSSGRVVTTIGSYDPHTKAVTLDKEKAEQYLANGAQPSDRVVKLLSDQKVKLPEWVKKPVEQKKTIRNPEKLRRNQPKEEAVEEVKEEAPAVEELVVEETKEQAPVAEEAMSEETKEAATESAK